MSRLRFDHFHLSTQRYASAVIMNRSYKIITNVVAIRSNNVLLKKDQWELFTNATIDNANVAFRRAWMSSTCMWNKLFNKFAFPSDASYFNRNNQKIQSKSLRITSNRTNAIGFENTLLALYTLCSTFSWLHSTIHSWLQIQRCEKCKFSICNNVHWQIC